MQSVATARSRGTVALALTVALAALTLAWLRLPYGVMFSDEGFYLATSDGVRLGAVPFRDDLSQATIPFFLVLTPFLRLLPEGGTLMEVRLVGLALRAVCSVVLLLVLRRWLSPLSLAAAFAVALLANFSFLLVPSYNSLPSDLGFVGVACWIHATEHTDAGPRWAWGFLAGLVFGLAALCYLPRVALVAVPFALALWARTRRFPEDNRRLATSSVACGAGMLTAFAAGIAALAAAGLWTDFQRSFTFFLTLRPFGLSFAARLYGLVAGDLPRAWLGAVAHAAFWAAALSLSGRAERDRAWLPRLALMLVAMAYALSLLGLYGLAGDRWHWAYYRIYPGLCWLPLLAYPWLRSGLQAEPPLTRAADLLFVTGLAQQLLVALCSSQGVAAGIPGLTSSLVLLFLIAPFFVRRCSSIEPAAARRATGSAALGLGLALALSAAARHFYADQDPLRGRQAEFTEGRLVGLRSHPRYVRGWSAVLRYLAPRLSPGEPLLAYDNLPLLYYATRTRPALGATYVSAALYTPAEIDALLVAMRAKGREPRYAVRLREGSADQAVSYSTRPDEDPLNAYVLANYDLEARLQLFDVYRRRGATPADTDAGEVAP